MFRRATTGCLNLDYRWVFIVVLIGALIFDIVFIKAGLYIICFNIVFIWFDGVS